MKRKKSLVRPKELLGHLESMTQHRDVLPLQISLVQSLHSLLRTERIRMYDICRRGVDYFLFVAAWNEKDEVRVCENHHEIADLHPLASHPFYLASADSLVPVVNEQVEGMYVTCLPLVVDNIPIAIFELCRATQLTQHELEIANGVLSVFRNYLGLLEDSQRDTLTGLLNRKTFDHYFSSLISSMGWWNESANPHFPERRTAKENRFWLAVVDVDHFKRINDKFGHVYGDEVLILLANIMRNSFRSYDRLFRFGGEEFVILMRHASFDAVTHKLELFRRHMEEYSFPQVERVTVSIGFVQVVPNDIPGRVLGQADEALYYAKEHGRNQVQCYTTLLEKGLLAPKTVYHDAEFF